MCTRCKRILLILATFILIVGLVLLGRRFLRRTDELWLGDQESVAEETQSAAELPGDGGIDNIA